MVHLNAASGAPGRFSEEHRGPDVPHLYTFLFLPRNPQVLSCLTKCSDEPVALSLTYLTQGQSKVQEKYK